MSSILPSQDIASSIRIMREGQEAERELCRGCSEFEKTTMSVSFTAGMVIGGEIGAFGGPIGAVVGIAVGVSICAIKKSYDKGTCVIL